MDSLWNRDVDAGVAGSRYSDRSRVNRFEIKTIPVITCRVSFGTGLWKQIPFFVARNTAVVAAVVGYTTTPCGGNIWSDIGEKRE
jgi:hypothetical protein